MNSLLLFSKKRWAKSAAQAWTREHGLPGRFRVGFAYLVFICDAEPSPLPLVAEEPVLSLRYDGSNHLVTEAAIQITTSGHSDLNTRALLEGQEGIGFDLRSFGFSPVANGAGPGLSYQAFRESADQNSLSYDLLFTEEAEKRLVACLAVEPQRLFIDILTLRATNLLVVKRMLGKDMLAQYSVVFLLAFTVRAQIEKTMLMFAHLDPVLDYKQLDASKKIRSLFLRQAKNSSWPPTLRFVPLLESVDVLDDMYRSPEIHKTGRLWSLISSGHFDTCFNEVMSFFNEHQQIMIVLASQLGTESTTAT